MLKIRHAPGYAAERRWIFDLLLRDFLGLEFSAETEAAGPTRIEADGRALVLADGLFLCDEKYWLTSASLPSQPLARWNTAELGLEIRLLNPLVPVVYGSPQASVTENEIHLGLDIFGSAFFTLSRYEEAVKTDRDEHDRFPAEASLACAEGFLDRPIVNEYLEILWACMKHLWPGLQRRARKARTLVTADVDLPYHLGTRSLKGLVRQVGGDLWIRHNPFLASKSMISFFNVRRGDYRLDPYYPMLDWIMNENEAAGNRMMFHFMADNERYSLDEPLIRNLLRTIAARGHQIGLHPGYGTYKDPALIRDQADALKQVLVEEKIAPGEIGSRQHYLQWETPTTARLLDAAGLKHDSTLSFADRPGFRCGICYEYDFFDLIERKPLQLRERPLVLMETSIMDGSSRNAGYDDRSFEQMMSYKRHCHYFDGDFVLLWHNSHFRNKMDRIYYDELIG